MSDEEGLPVVLMVDDSPGDVRLVREVVRDLEVPLSLQIVNDCEQAMEYLERRDAYSSAPRPRLILLDLNLPKQTGAELLGQLKRHPNFRDIPIVILTTSQSEQEIRNCYRLQANSYVIKPIDLDRFTSVLTEVVRYWLTVVRLPKPD